MKAPGKLAEFFLDYPAIAHKRAQIPCLHGWANCVVFHQKEDISKTPTHTPPKCDRRARPSWQEEPDQKRQRWTFAVAQNAATGNKGNPSCPCSVPSILSVRHDLGFVQLFSIKKVKLFSCHFILFTHIEKRPSKSFPN